MRFNHFLSILFAVSLASCLGTETTEYELSNDANVVSFSFLKNDSVPHLETAVFVIDNDNNHIYNPDSLPYQTRIDSVSPAISFRSTSGSMIINSKGDTIFLTGSDTIDFSAQPLTLINHPASQVKDSIRTYKISVNVHQLEPELYVWNKINDKVYSHTASQQKLMWFNEKLHLFVNSGINNHLYTSVNGVTWTQETLSGLQPNSNFRTMTIHDNTLYFSNGGAIYQSSNATDWAKLTNSNTAYSLATLLFSLNNELFAIVNNSAGEYYFAHSQNATDWTIGEQIPENFPIEGFANVTYTTKTNKEKALLLGGHSTDNEILNTKWSTEDGSYWVNFTIAEPEFGSMADASIIRYDEKLLLFGGVDKNNAVLGHTLLESDNEGLNWNVPDSTCNQFPETYELRTSQSVAVDNDHNIYIVGGKNRTTYFKDVWKGKINRLGFVE